MSQLIYFNAVKRFAAICFTAFFLSACSFGSFVKTFHIRSQHKIPTYQFSSPPKELKNEFEKLFRIFPELVLTDGHTNNYVDGTYFASVNDSVSKKKFAIRFGFYEEDSAKNNSSSTINIFSIRYDQNPEWISFFSKKIKRKEMKRIDAAIVKTLFSKIQGFKQPSQ